MHQRHATELFKPGEMVVLDDGIGEEVRLWVQKLSPTHREACVQASKSAQARVLATMNREDSDEWMAAFAEVLDLGDNPETLAMFLIADEYLEAAQSIEAQLADDDSSESRWAKDGFLRGLQGAWHGTREESGLKDVWARWISDHGTFTEAGGLTIPELGDDAPPEVQEAYRIYALINEFNDLVQERLAQVRRDLIASHASRPIEELRKAVVEAFIEQRAAEVGLRVFRRHRIYYTTRDPGNRRRMYFESLEDVDELDEQTTNLLIQAYEKLEVPALEGKDLPDSPDFSGLSGQPVAAATSAASGPEEPTP